MKRLLTDVEAQENEVRQILLRMFRVKVSKNNFIKDSFGFSEKKLLYLDSK